VGRFVGDWVGILVGPCVGHWKGPQRGGSAKAHKPTTQSVISYREGLVAGASPWWDRRLARWWGLVRAPLWGPRWGSWSAAASASAWDGSMATVETVTNTRLGNEPGARARAMRCGPQVGFHRISRAKTSKTAGMLPALISSSLVRAGGGVPTTVGSLVGVTVGRRVGLVVGSWEGRAVGIVVGSCVGSWLGSTEGIYAQRIAMGTRSGYHRRWQALATRPYPGGHLGRDGGREFCHAKQSVTRTVLMRPPVRPDHAMNDPPSRPLHQTSVGGLTCGPRRGNGGWRGGRKGRGHARGGNGRILGRPLSRQPCGDPRWARAGDCSKAQRA
jgi:hypothetical protein